MSKREFLFLIWTAVIFVIGIACAAETATAPIAPVPLKTEKLSTTESLALEAWQKREADFNAERSKLLSEMCGAHKIEVADCMIGADKTISQMPKPPAKAEEKK